MVYWDQPQLGCMQSKCPLYFLSTPQIGFFLSLFHWRVVKPLVLQSIGVSCMWTKQQALNTWSWSEKIWLNCKVFHTSLLAIQSSMGESYPVAEDSLGRETWSSLRSPVWCIRNTVAAALWPVEMEKLHWCVLDITSLGSEKQWCPQWNLSGFTVSHCVLFWSY